MVLKYGLVGCGRIGKRHAEQMKRTGKLVAVCDIDVAAGTELASAYDANFYDDIETLLFSENDIDVVAICTPNGLHASHSILSLKAGKHVLCEKPLCINSADAHRMIHAAVSADKKLYVVKQNRYNPPVEAVKQWL